MSDKSSIELLIVEDDLEFRGMLSKRFSQLGWRVEGVADAERAYELAQRRDFDVALLDMNLPTVSGLDLLAKFRANNIDCEAIMITGQATVETAVQAMKLGAYDYLLKPFPLKELESLIEKAFEHRQLAKENRQLKTLLAWVQPSENMVGRSPAMQEVFRLIERAGPSDKAILIQGESGTGKELVARALHQHSQRAGKPLVVINCAALPESLLESELFGHEKGAFTGAVHAKQGLFEVANGGTLLIDEIGEMPGSLQAKLLRVLEDGSLRRIGSIKELRVNVRLVAATNRNMAQEVQAGRFREDLYYRINVMSLELPPLRQRGGDLPLLIQHFVGPGWEVEPAAQAAMERYHWPGNVRQLINAIDRAKILADDQIIKLHDLPHEVTAGGSWPAETGAAAPPFNSSPSAAQSSVAHSAAPQVVSDDLAALQRSKIVEVLRRVDGNKTHAAKSLGIERRKLYRLLEKFQIRDEELFPAARLESPAAAAPSG